MCLPINPAFFHVLDRKSLEFRFAPLYNNGQVGICLAVDKTSQKISLINLSVEEENLAAIPFAVLERRVGKRISKIEVKGAKVLPDGREVRVVWQVQGNNELGLPTEQDLDIFVALGVLTFRNNFAKTVSFSGREIAKIINIRSVHGKFYQRLKMAMDRFIPLRFRSLTETEQQEEVKWSNVFQEASFSLDRVTNRCVGVITWTDKLIQSMDRGFFRAIDAGRYMQLDGITAKYLYRFLATTFEKTDLIVIDARRLAVEHLGILKLPKYFSRLMQTLEPALDQLVSIGVLSAYHVISTEEWTIALHRHASYLPERKNLLLQSAADCSELNRAFCERALERAGLSSKAAADYAAAVDTPQGFYLLRRAVEVVEAMKEYGVVPQVAQQILRRALETGAATSEARDYVDWCEIAVEICQQKKRAGQTLRNSAGLVIKIIKDPEARARLVGDELSATLLERFREREKAALRQHEEAETRAEVIEYEQYRRELAQTLFSELTPAARQALRREMPEIPRQTDRLDRLPAETREREMDELVLEELARKEVPPFEKWLLRKRAQQAVLPFLDFKNPEAHV